MVLDDSVDHRSRVKNGCGACRAGVKCQGIEFDPQYSMFVNFDEYDFSAASRSPQKLGGATAGTSLAGLNRRYRPSRLKGLQSACRHGKARRSANSLTL